MVIKRQKLFVAPLLMPLLTAGSIGITGAQMAQSADQASEAEDQNRQQVRALNRIAKAAQENPQVAQRFLAQKQKESSEIGSILSQREFGVINPQTVKNVQGFVKDLGKFGWSKRNKVLSGAVMGGTLAAGGAVVDKAIQKDAKRNGIPIGNSVPQEESSQQKQYSTEQSILEKGQNLVKRGAKAAGREFKGQFKGTMGKILTPAFIAMPAVGYLAEKKQYQDQIASTNQKQFAKISPSVMKSASQWLGKQGNLIKDSWTKFKGKFNKWKDAPVKNSMNGLGGFLGQRGDKMAEQFTQLGKESGNKYTQQLGDFLTKHGKTAAAGGIAVGSGIMAAGWGQGEKITKKAIKSVDPNAYAYQESKEQPVQ